MEAGYLKGSFILNAFIEKIKDEAMETQRKYGVLASLTIAQAILETGWGKYSVGNNIFGIKTSPSWTGRTVTCKTGEVYDGQAVTVSGTFRGYDSIADSIEDHAKLFVNNDCYHNLLNCTDYKQACRNVQADGYATDPHYADTLISIIEDNDLTQFDKAASTPAPAAPSKPAPAPDTYTVQSGDTLSGIAYRYGTTYQHLAEINGISDPNIIRVGQVLHLTGSAPVASSGGSYTVQAGDTISGVVKLSTSYTVQSGDTLSGIAARFGTTYQTLAAINGIANPNLIHVGQVICLTGNASTAATMRTGARVQYSGRVYGDSYGEGAGRTVSGTYAVDNYISGRACAVHIPAGWVPESGCTVVG